MTKTLRITLSPQQIQFLEDIRVKYGFLTKSEIIRSFIRWLSLNPESTETLLAPPLIPPKTRSRKEILEAFEKTGKYSPEFLKDLEEGLKNSDYFNE